ncbi:hypothetical protein KIL84_014949 [Mauremys mutica]|uniref:Uncharacterized protein n=1 Tax=Mauremys mutica TaxID=74926 RepID=A0A9D4B7P2_9SAUR|nr:hypothetical protein KIL84_014949 [Mauremys mutica]
MAALMPDVLTHRTASTSSWQAYLPPIAAWLCSSSIVSRVQSTRPIQPSAAPSIYQSTITFSYYEPGLDSNCSLISKQYLPGRMHLVPGFPYPKLLYAETL